MSEIEIDTTVLDQLIASMPGRIDTWGRGIAESIVNDIKLIFNTSPPGRTYVRGSVTHTASSPGYAPNVDTGALRASMRWEKQRAGVWHVMDGVEYGYWLEDGTSRMQPRPFVQPVFAKWRQQVEREIAAFGDMQ